MEGKGSGAGGATGAIRLRDGGRGEAGSAAGLTSCGMEGSGSGEGMVTHTACIGAGCAGANTSAGTPQETGPQIMHQCTTATAAAMPTTVRTRMQLTCSRASDQMTRWCSWCKTCGFSTRPQSCRSAGRFAGGQRPQPAAPAHSCGQSRACSASDPARAPCPAAARGSPQSVP